MIDLTHTKTVGANQIYKTTYTMGMPLPYALFLPPNLLLLNMNLLLFHAILSART